MCWVPVVENKKLLKDMNVKLSVERALYEIEQSNKSVFLTVQTIMDLTFPLEIS